MDRSIKIFSSVEHPVRVIYVAVVYKYNKIIIVLLAILPIHSLSFCDNSPNGDTSVTSACLAKLCTFSGTVQRIVQC